jgi:hypothetical protein
MSLKAANEVKFVGPVEISAIRETHPLSPGPYLLCIRGSRADASSPRAFAVFFKNNDYISTRGSVSLDNCEGQAFSPRGTGPFAVPVKKEPT